MRQLLGPIFLLLFLIGRCHALAEGTWSACPEVPTDSVGAVGWAGTILCASLSTDSTGNTANLTVKMEIQNQQSGETDIVSIVLEGFIPTVTSSPDFALQLLPTWESCAANTSLIALCGWAINEFGNGTFYYATSPADSFGSTALLVTGWGESIRSFALVCSTCASATNDTILTPGTYATTNLDIPMVPGPLPIYFQYSLYTAALIYQPGTQQGVQFQVSVFVTPLSNAFERAAQWLGLVGAGEPSYVGVTLTGYMATVGSAGGPQCATTILPVWTTCASNDSTGALCPWMLNVFGQGTPEFSMFALSGYTATGLIINQWGPLTYNLALTCTSCESSSGLGQCIFGGGGGGGGNSSVNIVFNGGLQSSPSPIRTAGTASLANLGTASTCTWANLATDSKGRVPSCTSNPQPVIGIVAGSSTALAGQVVLQNNASNPNIMLFSNPSGNNVQAALPVLPPSPVPAQYKNFWDFPASMISYFLGDGTTSCTYCSIVRDAYGRIVSLASGNPVTSLIDSFNGAFRGDVTLASSTDMMFSGESGQIQGLLATQFVSQQACDYCSVELNEKGIVTAASPNTPVVSFNGADGPVTLSCDASCTLTKTSATNFQLHSNGGGGGSSVPFVVLPYKAPVSFTTSTCKWPGSGALMRANSYGQITFDMQLVATRYVGAGPTDPNYGFTQVTATFSNFRQPFGISFSSVDCSAYSGSDSYVWGSNNYTAASQFLQQVIPNCYLPVPTVNSQFGTEPNPLFFPVLMADGGAVRQFGWWIFPAGRTGPGISTPGAIIINRLDQGSSAYVPEYAQILGPTYTVYGDGGENGAGSIGDASQLSFSWSTVITDSSCDQGPPLPGTNCSYALSGSTLAFGSVVDGQSSSLNLTFYNNGINGYVYSGETIAGANPSQFSVTATTCSGTIAGGAQCQWTVQFSPTSVAPLSATFQPLLSCSSQAAVIDVYLSGTGTPVPTTPGPTTTPPPATTTPPPTTAVGCGTPHLSVSSVNFGDVNSNGNASPYTTVTVTNVHSLALTWDGLNVISGSFVSAYQELLSAPGECANGIVLTAGQSCVYTVRFVPVVQTSGGSQPATVLLNSTCGSSTVQAYPVTLSLTGSTTHPACPSGSSVLSPTSFAFGTVTTGTTRFVSVFVSVPAGSDNITNIASNIVGPGAAYFAVDGFATPNCGPGVTPGNHCQFLITASSSAFPPPGAQSATVQIFWKCRTYVGTPDQNLSYFFPVSATFVSAGDDLGLQANQTLPLLST